MPASRLRGQPLDQSLCRRCQSAGPAITVRTEPLCRVCFARYVSTKVVKRMESFRVRNAELGKQRRLLLPLALDASSVTLLHILSQHLQGQMEKTGRTGYRLSVIHVANPASPEPQLALVMKAYPDHEYCTVALSDALALRGVSELVNQDRSAQGEVSDRERFMHVINSLPSNTARADVEQLLMKKLIVHHARQLDCEAVLWADNTTKLAERVLSETAKGRGYALPWVVADADSPYGVPFYYPLSDLLSKEVASYAAFTEPSLEPMIIKSASKALVSSRNTTIDDLMRDYFESVEQEYPSVVANVVKTSGKLIPTPLDMVEQQCELCDMPLAGAAPQRSRLCYGCIRSLPMISD